MTVVFGNPNTCGAVLRTWDRVGVAALISPIVVVVVIVCPPMTSSLTLVLFVD